MEQAHPIEKKNNSTYSSISEEEEAFLLKKRVSVRYYAHNARYEGAGFLMPTLKI